MFSFSWYMRGLTASLHYRITKTEHTVESFNSVENCFILFRMCSYTYKSVPVFSIPAFTKCLNLAARYKTLLRDTVGTSDYMDPAGGRRSPIRILQKCIKYSESFKVFALIHLKC